MAMSDPIADMLTRIRNGVGARKKEILCLNSKVCRGVAQILKEEGYIDGFEEIEDGRQGKIRLRLRYGDRGEDIIHVIKRESKPGCRVYRKVDEIPSPLQGMGISIVSTSKGVMSDRKCREERMGGELLATVY